MTGRRVNAGFSQRSAGRKPENLKICKPDILTGNPMTGFANQGVHFLLSYFAYLAIPVIRH